MYYDAGKAAFRCVIAAFLIAASLSGYFWGDALIVVFIWVLAFPFALVLGNLYGFIGGLFGWTPVDFDELEDMEYDLESDDLALLPGDMWVNDDAIDGHIEYSEEIVGRYKDADIHEWAIAVHPETGEKIKCYYETVIELDYGFNPPDRWFILAEPGILYISDVETEPENTLTEATI